MSNNKKRKNMENSPVDYKYLSDKEKYKWTTSGNHEENNVFPFSFYQAQELIAEFVETTENLYLNKRDHERGIVDILIGAARILRRIQQINPRGSHMLCYSPTFNKDIDFFEQIRAPYLPEEHDMYYVVDLKPNNNQLIHSISRYLEGLVYSKVSEESFIQVKHNPQYIVRTPYMGIEMIYNIIDSSNLYEEETRPKFGMDVELFTQVNTLD